MDKYALEEELRYIQSGGPEMEAELRRRDEWERANEERRREAERLRRHVEEHGAPDYVPPPAGSWVREPYESHRWHLVKGGRAADVGEGIHWRRVYSASTACLRTVGDTIASVGGWAPKALRSDACPTEGRVCKRCEQAAMVSDGLAASGEAVR